MHHSHHHESEQNQFMGKELKNLSQAGFDLDRIHIKVSFKALTAPLSRSCALNGHSRWMCFEPADLWLQRNAPIASLYEDAIQNEGAVISSNGALINFSGKKTGRSPKDKRIVFEETSKDEIWWGPVNIKME